MDKKKKAPAGVKPSKYGIVARGMRRQRKPPKGEKGTNAGRSSFCNPVSHVRHSVRQQKPPEAACEGRRQTPPPWGCPKGHPQPKHGWTR